MTQVRFELGGVLRFADEGEAGCFVTLRFGAFTVTARGDDMSYSLPSGMQVHIEVSYVDAAGNPAKVDGDVTWSSSDETIATVTSEPPSRAIIRAVGPVGQAQIMATADADLGEGVRPLVTTMDVAIVAGEAVAGSIEPVGAAEPIPTT